MRGGRVPDPRLRRREYIPVHHHQRARTEYNHIQLWDVAADQVAVDLIREIEDAQYASEKLLKHALSHHTTDNVTVLVIRFKKSHART